jgi:hypothetical protein
VKSADIEYKNLSEQVFRTTTRPIQKLVVLVPLGWHKDNERAMKCLQKSRRMLSQL